MADRGTIEWEIAEAIKRFGVRMHYTESSRRKSSIYAVWDNGGQTSTLVSDPTHHAGAHKDCLRLQVAAIMEIMEREAAHGREH